MAELLDVITLQDAKDELRLQSAAQDGALALFVSAVSQRLDVLCGPIVARAVTEVHDGGEWFITPRSPVLSFTTVTEYQNLTGTVLTAETNAVKAPGNYYLDDLRLLRRRSVGSDIRFTSGRGNVVLVYQAGRFASTADVSAKFRLAARIMVKHFWRFEAGAGSQTFGAAELAEGIAQIATFAVPRVVAELLAGETITGVLVG